jgi:hypothetical protein
VSKAAFEKIAEGLREILEMKKPIWDKKRPDSVGKPKKLTPAKKSAAKAAAKKAGRPYPNLIDNMQAARKNK